MIKNIHEKFTKNWLKILLVVFVVGGGYYLYNSANPVRSELSQIQTIAQDYKTKNGNFGILQKNDNTRNCFSGNTFLKLKETTDVLTSPDVENISCVFKVSTSSGVVEDWSVTIVKGESAYCDDSSGNRTSTPGLTTTHKCDGTI